MSTWIVLASGPSMLQEDADAVRGRGTVVAVNNTVAMAPWADILYSCDSSWWSHYSDPDKAPEMAAVLAGFTGERISIDPLAQRFRVRVMRREAGDGLGLRALRTGNNSGYQAINLAFLRGAKTILLLGLDMQHTDGKVHHHADHPPPLGNFHDSMPALCRGKFPALARDLAGQGVRVINCTRQTALTCFERMPLAAALRSIPRHRTRSEEAGHEPAFSLPRVRQ